MKNPLVTVIVLCYNQASFVEDAILSVYQQTYPNIELIIVDDASTDGSSTIIQKLSQTYSFRYICNSRNKGNCVAFNQALRLARGEYMIDLAADDILLPSRIQTGVDAFALLPDSYGVHFTDVELIDQHNTRIGTHYRRNEDGHLAEEVPEGWIFPYLVERYFICTPSMMIKKIVFDDLDGYDETLAYEDFDFWIRSSRKYQYSFSDKILVRKRVLKGSLSGRQKKIFNPHLHSTKRVCDKIFQLCETPEEYSALIARISYEMKWALFTLNIPLFFSYMQLKRKVADQLK